MVQVVKWRARGTLQGDSLWNPGLPDASFVPTGDSAILRDGDDATYVEAGEGEVFHAKLFSPDRTVPFGLPEWARYSVRVQNLSSGPSGDWTMRLTTWVDDDLGNRAKVDNGYRVSGTSLAATTPGQIFTEIFTVHRGGDWHDDTNEDRYAYGDWLDIFAAANPWAVTLSEFGAGSNAPDEPWRIYDVLVEVAYPGSPEWPLRQIQRDDHLAPGGAIRASTGTSRQGSIRQRGYY